MDIIQCIYENNKVNITVQFNELLQEGFLMVAIYDDNGRLVGIKQDVVMLGVSEKIFEFNADEDYKDYKIKVFYWAEFNSSKPYAAYASAEIE